MNVRWRDAAGRLLREDGAYGALQVRVGNQPMTVESILDLQDPELRIYHAEPGISQAWAQTLTSAAVRLGRSWSTIA